MCNRTINLLTKSRDLVLIIFASLLLQNNFGITVPCELDRHALLMTTFVIDYPPDGLPGRDESFHHILT